jgi:two-component system, cell cycle sensor histidine kinase and response regulator CckA
MVGPGSTSAGGLREFEAARMRIARLHVGNGVSLTEVLRSACEIAAHVLEVERVGVWLFTDEHRAIRCEALFERTRNTHSEGALLRAADFPTYCRALEERRDIPAGAARRHGLTRELGPAYLEPLGIASMLDAPVYRSGKVAGVVCHEHSAERQWTDEERDFAGAVADAVARFLEEDELSDAEARLRAQEDYLSESRKMEALGRLAAGVAHDFRNFLTVVIGCADEIRRASTTPRIADSASEILDTAQRAAALIKDLLAFGREESRAPRVLDVGEVVDSMATVLRTAVSGTHPIDVRCQRPIGRVLVDRSQLERVLLNLVLNARDAMPQGGRIGIDVREEQIANDRGIPGIYVLLEVSDTGTGMDAATRARLFEPFFTTKPAGRGTGIGLAVVYRAVERCGGFLKVDSELGRGTRMRVFLPRVAAER